MPVFAYLLSICFYTSAFPRLPWQWKTRRQEEERGQSISPFLALVGILWQWWHLLCPCSFPPGSPFLWGHSSHQVDSSWLSSFWVLGIGCLQPWGRSGFLLWLPPILCIYATKSCINTTCLKYLKLFLFPKEQVVAAFAAMAKIKSSRPSQQEWGEALLKQLGDLKMEHWCQ